MISILHLQVTEKSERRHHIIVFKNIKVTSSWTRCRRHV